MRGPWFIAIVALGTVVWLALYFWHPAVTLAAFVALFITAVVWPWIDRKLDDLIRRFTE